MGKKALSGRENWQTESGPGGRAGIAEKDLYKVFKEAFEGTDYVLRSNLTAMRGGRVCTASHVYFRPVGFTAGDGGGE